MQYVDVVRRLGLNAARWIKVLLMELKNYFRFQAKGFAHDQVFLFDPNREGVKLKLKGKKELMNFRMTYSNHEQK